MLTRMLSAQMPKHIGSKTSENFLIESNDFRRGLAICDLKADVSCKAVSLLKRAECRVQSAMFEV